jgi:branched-subunit amino acid transport protein
MALAVYLPKLLPLALVSERQAARLRGWLQYVAPAVLGALVAPSIVAPAGHLQAPGWEIVGYVLGGIVAATTRHMVGALAVGLAGIVLAALLVGVLKRGQDALALETEIPIEILIILQGVLILSVVIAYEIGNRRLANRRQREVRAEEQAQELAEERAGEVSA